MLPKALPLSGKFSYKPFSKFTINNHASDTTCAANEQVETNNDIFAVG